MEEEILEKIEEFKKRALRIAEKTGVDIPDDHFFYGIISCYKCGKEILIFTWIDESLENHEGSMFAMYSQSMPDEKNKPKTVKYVKSATIENSYWANNCPYCNALQGDFFLHAEPDYPFFVGAYDKKESFEETQKRIIEYNIDLLES